MKLLGNLKVSPIGEYLFHLDANVGAARYYCPQLTQASQGLAGVPM